MDGGAHGEVEQIWDDAVTAVAVEEGILKRTWLKDNIESTELHSKVKFEFKDCEKGKALKFSTIPKNGLMYFMIDVCITSKKRGQQLFPVKSPQEMNKQILPKITREIFSDCISNLVSIWRYIWANSRV